MGILQSRNPGLLEWWARWGPGLQVDYSGAHDETGSLGLGIPGDRDLGWLEQRAWWDKGSGSRSPGVGGSRTQADQGDVRDGTGAVGPGVPESRDPSRLGSLGAGSGLSGAVWVPLGALF